MAESTSTRNFSYQPETQEWKISSNATSSARAFTPRPSAQPGKPAVPPKRITFVDLDAEPAPVDPRPVRKVKKPRVKGVPSKAKSTSSGAGAKTVPSKAKIVKVKALPASSSSSRSAKGPLKAFPRTGKASAIPAEPARSSRSKVTLTSRLTSPTVSSLLKTRRPSAAQQKARLGSASAAPLPRTAPKPRPATATPAKARVDSGMSKTVPRGPSPRVSTVSTVSTVLTGPPLMATLSTTKIPLGSGEAKKPPTFKPPPQGPDLQICTAFPGTPEWDSYWAKFNSSMSKYTTEMAEYEKGMEIFSEDLERYKKQAAGSKTKIEQGILKRKDGFALGLAMDIVPPLITHSLEGLHVLNGYIIKGKNMSGTVSSVPGQPTGIRVELDLRGVDPERVLTQKEFNLLTVSVDEDRFLRIGTPEGKTAADIEVWPVIHGIIILEGP